jgi:hypothetical protein
MRVSGARITPHISATMQAFYYSLTARNQHSVGTPWTAIRGRDSISAISDLRRGGAVLTI